MLIDFIAVVAKPVLRAAVPVPDSGTTMSLWVMALGAIAFVRAKLK